jgi:alcohol dehydrogenase class IV
VRSRYITSIKELGVYKDRFDQSSLKMAVGAITSGGPGNNPHQVAKEEIIELYKLTYSQS